MVPWCIHLPSIKDQDGAAGIGGEEALTESYCQALAEHDDQLESRIHDSDVLQRQRVLFVPAEQCQRRVFQHSHSSAEWCSVLVCANLRRSDYWSCSRYAKGVSAHEGEGWLGAPVHSWNGHLGRRICFSEVEDRRLTKGLKQDIDFADSSISVGLIFLYISYGMYNAL